MLYASSHNREMKHNGAQKNNLKNRGIIPLSVQIYSFSRILIEFFREPDKHIGYIFPYLTMGIILSIPFLLLGLFLIATSYKK